MSQLKKSAIERQLNESVYVNGVNMEKKKKKWVGLSRAKIENDNVIGHDTARLPDEST